MTITLTGAILKEFIERAENLCAFLEALATETLKRRFAAPPSAQEPMSGWF